MSIKQASWTHGISIAPENRPWRPLCQGFGTNIIPSNETTFGWIHFAIPTMSYSSKSSLSSGNLTIALYRQYKKKL
jgi:hypothetical protein